MRISEPKRTDELTAAEVKKGDAIAIVLPWNFCRQDKRREGRKVAFDVYLIRTGIVTAIGKKVMRVELANGRGMLGENVWLMDRSTGERCFQSFVTTADRAEALAADLHATDANATETYRLLTIDEARELSLY